MRRAARKRRKGKRANVRAYVNYVRRNEIWKTVFVMIDYRLPDVLIKCSGSEYHNLTLYTAAFSASLNHSGIIPEVAAPTISDAVALPDLAEDGVEGFKGSDGVGAAGALTKASDFGSLGFFGLSGFEFGKV